MYCGLCTSVCPLVIKSYTIIEEVSPITPRKYTILNGNFVFNLNDFFRNGGLL